MVVVEMGNIDGKPVYAHFLELPNQVGAAPGLSGIQQQIQAVIEYVLAGLPVYLKRVLSAANGLALATA